MRSELLLAAGAAEAEYLHPPGAAGNFALLTRAKGGRVQQSIHPVTELRRVLCDLDRSNDTWISQNRFVGHSRRAVDLLHIGLLFTDLDTYRHNWAIGKSPDQLVEIVLKHCATAGIPLPSLLIYSGRGLQAKWLLKGALPREALPRWNVCQRFLCERLLLVGADPKATDACRVLRLVSTVNSKSGEVCREVYCQRGSDGHPVRHDFEVLAGLLLPFSRQEVEQRRNNYKSVNWRKRWSERTELETFCGRQLAWDRLSDLRRLALMRGGLAEGWRMEFLFWSINFLLLSGAATSASMYREARSLVHELAPGWSDYRSQELMTLYAKARQHEAGKKIDFNGKKYSPLYTPKNQTLIEKFEITEDEQRRLRTIITPKIKNERKSKKLMDQRRAGGVLSREVYLLQSNAKRLKALELRSQGRSIRDIAKELDIGKSTVGRYLHR